MVLIVLLDLPVLISLVLLSVTRVGVSTFHLSSFICHHFSFIIRPPGGYAAPGLKKFRSRGMLGSQYRFDP